VYNFQKSRYGCISFLSCPVVNIYQLKRVIWSASEAIVKPKFSFVMWITWKHMWVLSVWKNENSVRHYCKMLWRKNFVYQASVSHLSDAVLLGTHFKNFDMGCLSISPPCLFNSFVLEELFFIPVLTCSKILIPQ
jgi:hypothetical protein